jgi:hypothetical protein
MFRLAHLLALASIAAGCPAPGTRRPEPELELRRHGRALSLPPTEATLVALEALRRTEGAAACAAQETRLHYLLDLFDFARLAPRTGEATPGHAELWRALALPGLPGRGPLATRMVLERIGRARATTRSACGGRSTLVAASDQLLELDGRPRRTLDAMRAVARAYKRIAAGAGPLAANAELRLLDWCSKAIRLAAGGDPAAQPARINQCLLTLWDADPTPYFDPRPALRPTDPPWTLLADRLGTRRARLAGEPAAARLRPLVRALAEDDQRFRELAAPILPTPLDLSKLPLPRSTAGAPWDRTPLVLLSERGALVGGRAILAEAEDAALESAIAVRLHNDRRGRVCLAAAASASVARVLEVARAARRAGASILELAVVREVARRAPPGDVQATLFGSRPVLRLEALPVSLALYSAVSAGGRGRDQPLGITFDRDSAPSELALILGRTEVTAVSRDGVLAPRPRAELDALLATLRRAYPEDRSLLLGLEASLSHGELLRVLEVTLRAPHGFAAAAIAASGMVPRGEGDLGATLRTLEALRIAIEPAALRATLAPRLRRCYLDARLEARKAEGELVLRASEKGARTIGGSLRSARKLRGCVEASLAGAGLERGARVEVRFSLGT